MKNKKITIHCIWKKMASPIKIIFQLIETEIKFTLI